MGQHPSQSTGPGVGHANIERKCDQNWPLVKMRQKDPTQNLKCPDITATYLCNILLRMLSDIWRFQDAKIIQKPSGN